jgi:ferrous iron transport protein B
MKVALIGNQNSGKTTLFNLLTGHNQKIGNWPGVTIERKEGRIRSTDFDIIDLPGIYSLSPYTIEEEISRKYLFEENVDLILNIIDSTNLERSLYLTTQLLELDIPVIVALNMSDIAFQRGIDIDYKYLEEKLDTTMIPISALKKTGVFDLIQVIKTQTYRKNNYTHIYDHQLEDCLDKIEAEIKHDHQRYIAIKLIENDRDFESFHQNGSKKLVEALCKGYNRDMEQIIADERYRYIENIRDESIKSSKQNMTATDKLDRIFLNRYLAIPIFILIMFSVYYLAAGPIGSATVDFVIKYMDIFSQWASGRLDAWGASAWSKSLVIDGIFAGVGAILSFLPQLAILFLLISFLETTGYMSRIAFFLDKVFQKVGLSGKSLIPFIIGSGCSVPAIMSARTIHDETEKKMTILLTPFVPCSAKLPIIVLFAGYFFGDYSGLVSVSLYFFAVLVIILSAFIMKTILFKGKTTSFILELPNYKLPNYRYIFKDVFDKVLAFVKQAGSIIVIASISVWFLLNFSFSFEYGIASSESMLAGIGKLFSWIFYPFLGTFSWEATVSAIQGLVAKEQIVASMAIISGNSEQVSEGIFIFNSQAFSFFTPASAYAFMVFNLFSAPCFGAIGAMRRELGTTKRMWKAVFFQTGIAWLMATLVYQFLHIFEVVL